MRRPAVLFLALVAMASMLVGPAAPAGAATGPALDVPAESLAASLTCSGTARRSGPTPVLLVPGTTLTAEVNYSWNYEKVFSGPAGRGVRSPCRTTP